MGGIALGWHASSPPGREHVANLQDMLTRYRVKACHPPFHF
jgi:hypothetical protein